MASRVLFKYFISSSPLGTCIAPRGARDTLRPAAIVCLRRLAQVYRITVFRLMLFKSNLNGERLVLTSKHRCKRGKQDSLCMLTHRKTFLCVAGGTWKCATSPPAFTHKKNYWVLFLSNARAVTDSPSASDAAGKPGIPPGSSGGAVTVKLPDRSPMDTV